MIQVSVIIPVYNTAAHLQQCLDSVARQTLLDIEIICVDDGSTDESPAILAGYAARDSRFQVVTQPNAGPGAARNTGMTLASGEFVIFLDSDDWFELDFLEKMVQRARETGADVTICRAVEFDIRTGEELPSEWMLKKQYLPGNCFTPEQAADYLFQFTYGWPWDKLYRADFIEKNGLTYPALPNSEDLVFVFQGFPLTRRIAVLDEILVHHRVNRGSSVSNSRKLAPEAPYQALSMLRDALKRRSLYEAYERTFLNWAMEFLIWNVANMGDRPAQKFYFQKLKGEWLPQMGFDAHPAAYYEDSFTYAKYILVRYTPYSVFSMVLTVYQKWKRRKGDNGWIPVKSPSAAGVGDPAGISPPVRGK